MHADKSETYIISAEPFGDKDLAPGDIIRVTGKTADGDLEVVCEHNGEEKPWQEDLEDSMPEDFGGRMKPEEDQAYG